MAGRAAAVGLHFVDFRSSVFAACYNGGPIWIVCIQIILAVRYTRTVQRVSQAGYLLPINIWQVRLIKEVVQIDLRLILNALDNYALNYYLFFVSLKLLYTSIWSYNP